MCPAVRPWRGVLSSVQFFRIFPFSHFFSFFSHSFLLGSRHVVKMVRSKLLPGIVFNRGDLWVLNGSVGHKKASPDEDRKTRMSLTLTPG